MKEGRAAYQVLSDKARKQKDDKSGHAAWENGGGGRGGDGSGEFAGSCADSFEDLGGDLGGGRRRRH